MWQETATRIVPLEYEHVHTERGHVIEIDGNERTKRTAGDVASVDGAQPVDVPVLIKGVAEFRGALVDGQGKTRPQTLLIILYNSPSIKS